MRANNNTSDLQTNFDIQFLENGIILPIVSVEFLNVGATIGFNTVRIKVDKSALLLHSGKQAEKEKMSVDEESVLSVKNVELAAEMNFEEEELKEGEKVES